MSTMKAMFILNISPATAINAVWGSQWYQGSVAHVQKSGEKKAGDFWQLPDEITAQLLKKMYLSYH